MPANKPTARPAANGQEVLFTLPLYTLKNGKLYADIEYAPDKQAVPLAHTKDFLARIVAEAKKNKKDLKIVKISRPDKLIHVLELAKEAGTQEVLLLDAPDNVWQSNLNLALFMVNSHYKLNAKGPACNSKKKSAAVKNAIYDLGAKLRSRPLMN